MTTTALRPKRPAVAIPRPPRLRVRARALAPGAGRRARRRYAVAWLGGIPIAIVNGTVRELVYKDRVGDLAAHQISTATAIALFAGYLWILERRWPIPTARTALEVGATWLVLTTCFESGFGHYVDGRSWQALLHDYDLSAGRVWSLVLLWLAVGPLIVRRLRAR